MCISGGAPHSEVGSTHPRSDTPGPRSSDLPGQTHQVSGPHRPHASNENRAQGWSARDHTTRGTVHIRGNLS